jgi:hypothetical protein
MAKEMKNIGKKLHTFSVGFQDSKNINSARKIAEFINSEHHELIITQKDILDNIEKVIEIIETCCANEIKISIPIFLLCQWISENFSHKILFVGGTKLLKNIDTCAISNGLAIKSPYLDHKCCIKDFIGYIPLSFVSHETEENDISPEEQEKYYTIFSNFFKDWHLSKNNPDTSE